MQSHLLAMSKELIARVAGDAIRLGPHGPAALDLRKAAAQAALAIRILESEGVPAGKVQLIEAIECYLAAHGCRPSRMQIAREVEDELNRRVGAIVPAAK